VEVLELPQNFYKEVPTSTTLVGLTTSLITILLIQKGI
jgi:hypothetical protein